MTEHLDLDKIEKAAKAATPGEWGYRTSEYDDWGYVRVVAARPEDGDIVACARARATDAEMAKHRVDGTDPFGPNAVHIVASQPRNVLALVARLREAEAAADAIDDASRTELGEERRRYDRLRADLTAMEARAIAAEQARDEARNAAIEAAAMQPSKVIEAEAIEKSVTIEILNIVFDHIRALKKETPHA